MATHQIERFATDAALQAKDLGGSARSRPLGYVDDTDLLKYEDQGGTLRTVVDTDSAQTLTNKTITSPSFSGTPGGVLVAKEVTFTETAGAGVYTGSVTVPAGATLVDVIVHCTALWDNTGTAGMTVGINGVSVDGIYTGIDLKAVDLIAAESISFAKAGGLEGIDITATHVLRRYLATARVVDGIITTSSTGGSTGRTRMTVIYSSPVAADIVAATKV